MGEYFTSPIDIAYIFFAFRPPLLEFHTPTNRGTMKFKVTGSSRENGARMTLEFEAESRAAAERKATTAGMSVNRVEEISDGHVAHASEPRHSRRSDGGSFRTVVRLIVLAAIAVAIWYFWPQIMHAIRK